MYKCHKSIYKLEGHRSISRNPVQDLVKLLRNLDIRQGRTIKTVIRLITLISAQHHFI